MQKTFKVQTEKGIDRITVKVHTWLSHFGNVIGCRADVNGVKYRFPSVLKLSEALEKAYIKYVKEHS